MIDNSSTKSVADWLNGCIDVSQSGEFKIRGYLIFIPPNCSANDCDVPVVSW